MKISKEHKKPNCKEGNVACGKKCQKRTYRCPSEKGTEISKASDKFVAIVDTQSSSLASV